MLPDAMGALRGMQRVPGVRGKGVETWGDTLNENAPSDHALEL